MEDLTERDTYVEDLIEVACKRVRQRLLRRVRKAVYGPGDTVKIEGKFNVNFTIGHEGEYGSGLVDMKVEFNSEP